MRRQASRTGGAEGEPPEVRGRVAAFRAQLQASVVAREEVHGFLAGSDTPFAIRPPQTLPRNHLIVRDRRFRESFRNLTPAEIEHRVRAFRRRTGLSR
jgi:hypothetical protein